jgi:acyl-coenzyme A thioesterase 13
MSTLSPDEIRPLLSQRYSAGLAGLTPLEAKDGHARARIEVTASVANVVGGLHGGAIATLVDDVGTLAIMSGDRDGRMGVTTDLTVSYLRPAKMGEAVIIDARVLKVGRTLAVVDVSLLREADGERLAAGRMTKYLA